MNVSEYLKNIDLLKGGWYWSGCFGQTGTESLWAQKLNQYPTWYTNHADAKVKGIGKRVADCVGIDKFARWYKDGSVTYDKATDLSEQGLYNLAKDNGCPSGTIDTMPDVPGIVLWKTGHMGIYIGNGIEREARGGDYGIVDYAVKDRDFTHWYYNPFVDYGGSMTDIKYTSPTTKDDRIKSWQSAMNILGYGLTVDGSYGPASEAAQKKYETTYKLEIDGIVSLTDLLSLLGKVSDKCIDAQTSAIAKVQAAVMSTEDKYEATINQLNLSHAESTEMIKTSYESKIADIKSLYDKALAQLREQTDKNAELVKLNEGDVAELTATIDDLRKQLDDKPAEIVLVDLDNATLGELLKAAWNKIMRIK